MSYVTQAVNKFQSYYSLISNLSFLPNYVSDTEFQSYYSLISNSD